jgi:DNA processing protein
MTGRSGEADRRSIGLGSSALPGNETGELRRLLDPVTLHAPSAEPGIAEERFARAALTTAVEPGDLDAGRLLGGLGPVGLLRVLTDGSDAQRVLHLVRVASEERSQADEGEEVDVVLDGPVSYQPPEATDVRRSTEAASDAGAERRIAECLARWRPRLSLRESAQALERAARIGALLVTPHDDCWPEGLSSLQAGAPIALWVRGDAQRLRRMGRSVALVGARASTDYGEHVAMESAAGLSDRGFAIVSGGAYGIDAAAHRATLVSGGLTVAFLAGGVDRLYPAGNSDLLRRIAAEGVLAAELPPGNAPTRWRFLIRYRKIDTWPRSFTRPMPPHVDL